MLLAFLLFLAVFGVFGPVNHARAPQADQVHDFIVTDGLTPEVRGEGGGGQAWRKADPEAVYNQIAMPAPQDRIIFQCRDRVAAFGAEDVHLLTARGS